MAHGILLLGLNGCGKTTVGRRLAAELGFSALDAEDFYFPAPGDYSRSRSADEAHALMRAAIASGGDFVLSCVRCNLPHEILAQVQLCVVLHLSPEARAQRIHQRQFSRYGSRILPDGDLYEEHSLRLSASLNARWLKSTPLLMLTRSYAVSSFAGPTVKYVS